MKTKQSRFARALAAAAVSLLALSACSDDKTVTPSPVLSFVNVTLASPAVVAGLTTTATAAGVDQFGAPISTGTVVWSSSSSSVATVSTGGIVTGVAAGTAQIIATAGAKTGQQTVTVSAAPPVLTAINVTLTPTALSLGQTVTATAAGVDQYGAAMAPGAVVWSSTTPATATVNATTGVVTAVAAGTTQIVATSGTKTGQRAVTVTAPAAIKVNEVESNGGTPGDWIELFNPTAAAVDVSNWIVRDNDPTHTYRIPAGTTIAANGYLTLEEDALTFGLGAADDARLYNAFEYLVDSYTWTAHAATTYGRCANGSGAFATTVASTKNAANSCTPAGPTTAAWPGSDDVRTIDGTSVFNGNLSGLTYEGAQGGQPAVLWTVRNGPGTLYRMIFSGGIWTPDPANDWVAGKALKYTDNLGNTDAEGVTFAGGGSAGGIYVATERNNDASTISRNSILRFDPANAGATLRATHDWNITADLPVVGANLGIEAITWIPDSMLVANKFYDESKARLYAPADYADHGTGVFFVGVEGNGIIYAYALNHTNSTFTRVATITTGFPGVMALEYDRESGYLWATCDDGCNNTSGVLEIETTVGSPTLGRFRAPRQFSRPPSLPNINNEGFAFAPNAECVANRKPVFWADDSETGGHSIRTATIQCGTIPASVQQAFSAGRFVRP